MKGQKIKIIKKKKKKIKNERWFVCCFGHPICQRRDPRGPSLAHHLNGRRCRMNRERPSKRNHLEVILLPKVYHVYNMFAPYYTRWTLYSAVSFLFFLYFVNIVVKWRQLCFFPFSRSRCLSTSFLHVITTWFLGRYSFSNTCFWL